MPSSEGWKNLIPMNKRSKEEQRELSIKGGNAAALTYRRRKELKDIIKIWGEGEPDPKITEIFDKVKLPYNKDDSFMECVFKWLGIKFLDKKTSVTEILKMIDMYAEYTGQKPAQKIENVGPQQTVVHYVRDVEFDEINKHINETIEDTTDETIER